MRYDILHEVPGRMRVHCRNLDLRPENRIELKRWVSRHAELASATLSTRTGNLLVVYDRGADRHTILALLDGLSLFEGGNIGNPRDDAWSLAGAGASAALGEAVHALVKAVIPKPLDKALSGWKVGACAAGVGNGLAKRDFFQCLYALGKYVLFSLFASSLPMRFLLHLASSFADHLLARRDALLSHDADAGATTAYIPAHAAI